MWADIITNPLQVRSFREFRAELMNCSVDYEDENTCVDVGNTTRVSDTNDSQTVNTEARYRLYAESTRSIIKYSMASPQEFIGGNQNPEVPGRD